MQAQNRFKNKLKKFVSYKTYDLEGMHQNTQLNYITLIVMSKSSIEDKASKQFEEVNMSIQTSSKAIHKHLTGDSTVCATSCHRMQNELRDQTHQHSVTEEQSEIISELQREVKEQATTIKQQAVVMEELSRQKCSVNRNMVRKRKWKREN